MSFSNLLIKNSLNNCLYATPSLVFIRNGHRLRGKPPGIAKTLEQRLKGTTICHVIIIF